MIYLFFFILAAAIVGLLEWRYRNKPQLEGDFSSFDRWCPVKDCGWSFQTDEDFATHILEGLHGEEYIKAHSAPLNENT